MAMSILEIVAVIGIVGWVIARQLLGEPLRGKRLIVLPLVLAVIGAVDLSGHGHHPGTADIVMIAIEVVIAAGIGLGQGSMMRLEARNGVLWGQMPRRSLLLWLTLVVSHGLLDLVALGVGAHVAASTAPILLTLGINRLAQAVVVGPRAMAAGIPFAPEKDGSTFLPGLFAPQITQPLSDPAPEGRPGADSPIGGGLQSAFRLIANRLEERGSRR
jgi:hypothetical protein